MLLDLRLSKSTQIIHFCIWYNRCQMEDSCFMSVVLPGFLFSLQWIMPHERLLMLNFFSSYLSPYFKSRRRLVNFMTGHGLRLQEQTKQRLLWMPWSNTSQLLTLIFLKIYLCLEPLSTQSLERKFHGHEISYTITREFIKVGFRELQAIAI